MLILIFMQSNYKYLQNMEIIKYIYIYMVEWQWKWAQLISPLIESSSLKKPLMNASNEIGPPSGYT
jgi:hypothetical protein